MKFNISKEDSKYILDSLISSRKFIRSENQRIISLELTRSNISDRNNPTGELLPREVDCIVIKLLNGSSYFYEHNKEWEFLFNVVRGKTREEKLKKLGIN